MKRLFVAVLTLLALCLPLCVSADMPYISDEAGVLSENEISKLESLAQSVSDKHGIDVAVLTVDSLYGRHEMNVSDDYYDSYFGEDGVLLLYSIDDEIRYVSTCGSCIDAIDDNLSDISSAVSDPFERRNFAAGLEGYINTVDRLMTAQKIKGFAVSIAISLVAGLVVALVVTGKMKSQLDGAKLNARAENYLKRDSLKITVSRDLFLYRTVNRVPKPQSNSSTHKSSSGRTHGGGRV